MKGDQINLDFAAKSLSRFDKVIELLLIALLAFMPITFGAVEAWSEEVVIALAGAIAICFLLKLIIEKSHIIWSWSYIPVAVFVLIAVFQVINLPTGFVGSISPNTAAIKNELLSDLTDSETALQSMTLTFYPNATKHDLRLVLSVAAVFFVILNVIRRPNQIKRLLAVIAVIGGAMALLALAQDILGSGKIYWFISTGVDKADSGTFVNHSHYGQFMNLSIGAALGLLLVKLHEAFSKKKITPAIVFEYFSSPDAKTIWLLLIMIILGSATVFVSLTRGGMVSMLIAAGFTTLILTSRQSLKGRGWIMVLMAIGAFICVLYVGFDAVYDRLATLRELHEAQSGRWQIVKDIATAWTKFPLFGTGLGTHEVVYPMFDRSTTAALASHAENEYAQAAEETGLIGLIALVTFGIIVWISYARNVRSSSLPIRSAAYGLGFGLLAILLHSFSDFGQHMPANAFLSAVSCAILLALTSTGQKDNPTIQVAKASLSTRGLNIVGLVCVSAILVWTMLGANNARLAEASWKKTLTTEQSLSAKETQPEAEEYAALISNAAAAANYQPDNIKYQHSLNVYRWWSISGVTDPNSGQIIMPEQSLVFVSRIVSELNNARLLCPIYGATYCVVGQLQQFILNDPNGSQNIRKGYKLAPCDPTACFVAGLLDAEEKQLEASFEKFSKAIALDGRFFEGAADVYINQVSRPDIAVTLAGENIGWLSYVANALADIQEHKDVVENARIRVADLLKEECSKPDASALALASLANIYTKEKDKEAAIEYYRRALALEYGQVQWRFALAQALAETGKIPEAIHEARICLRLRPQFKAAEELIADLSILPGAVSDKDQAP